MMDFLLSFCRFTIAGLFAVSITAKICNPSDVKETLQNINFVPAKTFSILLVGLIVSECMVVASLLFGRNALLYGFYLATVLLLVFTVVLVWIVVRKIKTSCSCFGGNKRQVSWNDVYRNLLLVGMTVSGGIMAANFDIDSAWPVENMALSFVMALVFILVLLKADVVMDLLKN
jgi:cytochrome c oxidase subunit IV